MLIAGAKKFGEEFKSIVMTVDGAEIDEDQILMSLPEASSLTLLMDGEVWIMSPQVSTDMLL